MLVYVKSDEPKIIIIIKNGCLLVAADFVVPFCNSYKG